MIHLTTSTKLLAAGVVLSLGWIVLSACDCDQTKEQDFPGFWVSCVNSKPTLMTYSGDNATVVSSDPAGNFNPSQWDCSTPNSPPQPKPGAPTFKTGSPAGPGGFARPHASGNNNYAFAPERLLALPFTPYVPPSAQNCQATFPDILHVNHIENTVTRFSTCPFAFKTTIQVFQRPLQVEVTPDGSTAVVTSFGPYPDDSGGAVTFINLANNQIMNTLMMPFDVTPNGLAISPDGTTAYVSNFTNPGPSILVINIPTQTITGTIQNVVPYPLGLSLTPDGSQLWVTSPYGTETDVIDTLSQTVAFRLNIPESDDVAFNSTGTAAYITSDANTPGQVFAVDTSTYRTLRTYTVGNNPIDIRMSYGDQFLVVNNYDDGSVSIIDLRQDMVKTAQIGANPKGVAFVQ